jgi:hypothetical protein
MLKRLFLNILTAKWTKNRHPGRVRIHNCQHQQIIRKRAVSTSEKTNPEQKIYPINWHIRKRQGGESLQALSVVLSIVFNFKCRVYDTLIERLLLSYQISYHCINIQHVIKSSKQKCRSQEYLHYPLINHARHT